MVGRRHHLVRNEQGTTLRQDNHNRLDPKVADQFYLDLTVTFASRGDFRSPFQGRRVGWWVPNTGEDAENKCEFTHSRGYNYLDVVREGRREAGRQGAKKRELGGKGSLEGIVVLIGWEAGAAGPLSVTHCFQDARKQSKT